MSACGQRSTGSPLGKRSMMAIPYLLFIACYSPPASDAADLVMQEMPVVNRQGAARDVEQSH